jgi:hypothetical protein
MYLQGYCCGGIGGGGVLVGLCCIISIFSFNPPLGELDKNVVLSCR